MIYNLLVPWETLDPWQKKYIGTDPGKDCFLLCSRQSGKTTAMSIKAVELCVKSFKKGAFVLILSITEKQAYIMLAKALAYAIIKYPKVLITKGNDKPTKHKINFKTGTGILCYAAGETGEGLRGFTIKKLMIDEGSRMSEEFFIAVTPMLSVIGGSMDIASTPFGTKNKDGSRKFFYKCSKDDHFVKFYVSAEDCPRQSKEFLKREEERMTEAQYAQEYKAQFMEELYQYFSNSLIQKVMVIPKSEVFPNFLSSQNSRDDTFLGVDIARMGEDLIVLISLSRRRKRLRMIDMEIRRKQRLTETARLILEKHKKYNYKKIYIDTTGQGWGVFDILFEDNQTRRKVVSIENVKKSIEMDDFKKEGMKKKTFKEDLYENLKILMEQGKIELFDDPEIRNSLSSIQYDEETGKTFGNNTHIAEALVRAAWCMKDKSLKVFIY